jgi:hypothetical protein
MNFLLEDYKLPYRPATFSFIIFDSKRKINGEYIHTHLKIKAIRLKLKIVLKLILKLK